MISNHSIGIIVRCTLCRYAPISSLTLAHLSNQRPGGLPIFLNLLEKVLSFIKMRDGGGRKSSSEQIAKIGRHESINLLLLLLLILVKEK